MKSLTSFFRHHHSSLTAALLLFTTATFPFIVLPIGENFLVDPKIMVFFFVALLTSTLWIVASLVKKSIQITLSPFLFPLVAFGITVLVSSFLNGQFPINHLLGIGGIYLASVSLVIFGSSLLQKKSASKFFNALLIPAVVLSVSGIAEILKVGPSQIFGNLLQAEFPHTPAFTLTGSPLFTTQFLTTVLIGILVTVLANRKQVKSYLYLLPGIVVLLGLLVHLQTTYQLFKSQSVFLPYSASYYIATDTLKSAKSAIIGVGPEYYLHSYLQFKPGWINISPFWNTQFSQGSSFPFTILVTLGLVGLLSWLFFVFVALRRYRQTSPASISAATIFMVILLMEFFFPVNIVLLGVQTMALIFWIVAEKDVLKDIQLHAFTVEITKAGDDTQRVPKHSNVLPYSIALLSTTAVVLSTYWIGRLTIAQAYNFQANQAARQERAIQAYEFQKKAIQYNPYSDAYRRKYSLTNLAIAAAISNNKEASDEDKQKIAVLVQQAVREAKTATVLDPLNNSNWMTLASVYKNLIGATEGAENLAATAYRNAITVSPLDPVAHLEAGALLYRAGQYPQARQLYEKAVTLKPDWANAYYNLAQAYKQEKKNNEALSAYRQTLTLLSNTGATEDFNRVKAEADELAKLVQETTPSAEANGNKPTEQKPVVPASPKPSPTQQAISPAASESSMLSPQAKSALQGTDIEAP